MAEINAKDVMNLRNRTGLSMMACKAALAEAGGDPEKAEELLRKQLKGKMDTKTDRAAGDGRQGLAMADTHRPDLILMDLGLPEIDGWECIRRLRATDRTRHIPIIAITAHALVGDREALQVAAQHQVAGRRHDVLALLIFVDRIRKMIRLFEQDMRKAEFRRARGRAQASGPGTDDCDPQWLRQSSHPPLH